LRPRIAELVREGSLDELRELVSSDVRAVRYLLGLTYQHDADMRTNAARGIALAGRYHPKAVQGLVRRLLWAMNDDSGTNARTAPEVMLAISHEHPELLIPMIPDLMRLAADSCLQEGIRDVLREVAKRCPGEVAKKLGRELTERIERGGFCGAGDAH
jgi:hypothetical protein